MGMLESFILYVLVPAVLGVGYALAKRYWPAIRAYDIIWNNRTRFYTLLDKRRNLKMYRWYVGGLWVKFETVGWRKCEWVDNRPWASKIRSSHVDLPMEMSHPDILVIDAYFER